MSARHTAPPRGGGLASPVGWAVGGRGTEPAPWVKRESSASSPPTRGPGAACRNSCRDPLQVDDTLGQVGDRRQEHRVPPPSPCNLGIAGLVGTQGWAVLAGLGLGDAASVSRRPASPLVRVSCTPGRAPVRSGVHSRHSSIDAPLGAYVCRGARCGLQAPASCRALCPSLHELRKLRNLCSGRPGAWGHPGRQSPRTAGGATERVGRGSEWSPCNLRTVPALFLFSRETRFVLREEKTRRVCISTIQR